VRSSFDFSDAQVLVTGGSNGIGLAVARAFRDAGARVAITGTRSGPHDYDHDLSAFEYRQCLLSEPSSITAALGSLQGLDVLVNNAGQNLPGGRSEWEPSVFDEVVSVNLSGAFRMATACQPFLKTSSADGGASVINMGSMTSFFGLEITPAYGAAKAAVVQLTKTLAAAWARDAIRVNAVAPGTIAETNMTAPMMPFEEITGPIVARTPMRRLGTPADIAPVVLFLASPSARFVTGQTLAADGGYSIQG
jgi:NAD(P)-dependent dehydrogenase (short-subunit alcohol dehydrogenase family)